VKIALGTPLNAVPKPWLYFDVPALIVNALEAKRRNPRLALGYEGELWLDSGGFQVLRKGLQLAVEEVAEVYRQVEAQYYLSLDVPPSPTDPPDVAEKKFEKTYQNWVRLSRAVEGVVPVLHVYRDERLFLKYLRRYLDAPTLAIGGAVPYVLITRGAPRGSREYALRLIKTAREEFKGKLHVLGLGSPSVTPILEALGVDSTDTSTWRVKAAYGKVILPGGGERHVTGRKVNFGPRKALEEELEELRAFLAQTGFPALTPDFRRRLAESFEYRALVNAWVVLHSRTPPRSPAFRRLYAALAAPHSG